MRVPKEAILIFEDGGSTDDVVRAKVTNSLGVPVSSRQAREWRYKWKTGDIEDIEDFSANEITSAQNLIREIANAGLTDIPEYPNIEVVDEKVALLKEAPEVRIKKYREAAKAVTDLLNETDPIFTKQSRVFEGNKPIAILWPSCMHLGGRYTDHEFIERSINQFLEFGYIFFIGDEIEGFLHSWFHAGSVMEQALQVNLQIEMFDAFMERAWPKTLGGMWSQHGSMWFEKTQGYTPLKRRYIEHGVPFFDGKAKLTYKVGNQTYFIAASHEFSGVSQWNRNHPHVKALRFDYPSADVIVAGDKHTYAVQEMEVYTEEYESGRRPSPFVWLVQSGTAKTGPDKYTIKRWSKGEAEWPITVLYPDQHLVKVTRHIDDARRWIEEYDGI